MKIALHTNWDYEIHKTLHSVQNWYWKAMPQIHVNNSWWYILRHVLALCENIMSAICRSTLPMPNDNFSASAPQNTAYVQTQWNHAWYIHTLCDFLTSKGPPFQNVSEYTYVCCLVSRYKYSVFPWINVPL